jgi:hypothetical protein
MIGGVADVVLNTGAVLEVSRRRVRDLPGHLEDCHLAGLEECSMKQRISRPHATCPGLGHLQEDREMPRPENRIRGRRRLALSVRAKPDKTTGPTHLSEMLKPHFSKQVMRRRLQGDKRGM